MRIKLTRERSGSYFYYGPRHGHWIVVRNDDGKWELSSEGKPNRVDPQLNFERVDHGAFDTLSAVRRHIADKEGLL